VASTCTLTIFRILTNITRPLKMPCNTPHTPEPPSRTDTPSSISAFSSLRRPPSMASNRQTSPTFLTTPILVTCRL